jgi:GTP cyclohydrolase IA
MYNSNKMVEATKLFLEAIGHPNWQNDPNTQETPTRVAKMYEVMLGGYEKDPKEYLKVFPSKSQDMVLVKNIPVVSYCSHHLAPFYGTMAIAYVPKGQLVGLSKLVRFARVHLKRLQLQEDLTMSIADTLVEVLKPLGVMVHIEAMHTCMTIRGVRSQGATTVTSAARGIFKEDAKTRAEFMDAIKTNSNVFKY